MIPAVVLFRALSYYSDIVTGRRLLFNRFAPRNIIDTPPTTTMNDVVQSRPPLVEHSPLLNSSSRLKFIIIHYCKRGVIGKSVLSATAGLISPMRNVQEDNTVVVWFRYTYAARGAKSVVILPRRNHDSSL